jgi:hypothetical protein
MSSKGSSEQQQRPFMAYKRPLEEAAAAEEDAKIAAAKERAAKEAATVEELIRNKQRRIESAKTVPIYTQLQVDEMTAELATKLELTVAELHRVQNELDNKIMGEYTTDEIRRELTDSRKISEVREKKRAECVARMAEINKLLGQASKPMLVNGIPVVDVATIAKLQSLLKVATLEKNAASRDLGGIKSKVTKFEKWLERRLAYESLNEK